MSLVETDAETGVEIHQLTSGTRPTDNLYGEQPYSSPQGDRIAVCHYPAAGQNGGLSILDLRDGSSHPVLTVPPRFPPFHAWGEHLYYQEEVGGRLLLRRCHYRTLRKEEVMVLPQEDGPFSYGAVSPGHRYYAVCVGPADLRRRVMLYDLSSGKKRLLAESPDQHFKHEQFSQDGRNRLLIQANGPGIKVVNLGVLDMDGDGVVWLPVDAPPVTPYGGWPGGERYTPRCTGHEAWVGATDRVFLSTGYDQARGTNIWTAAVGDSSPTAVCKCPHTFCHVSVSRCGRYWIADATAEEGIPIYAGRLGSGECKRLVFSRTKHDGQQSSHTHPYLTANNEWLVFNSTRSGIAQVYGARVKRALPGGAT